MMTRRDRDGILLRAVSQMPREVARLRTWRAPTAVINHGQPTPTKPSETTRRATGVITSLFASIGLLVGPVGITDSASATPTVNIAPADQVRKSTPSEADAVLTLDEPATLEQKAEHRIYVLNDGLAHIHIKPAKGQSSETIDLSLSAFKAEDQPSLAIGFADDKPASGPRLASRQKVEVSEQGADITLNALGLSPGLDYAGKLYAMVGQRQQIKWNIVLSRPLVVPPFECPQGPQILKSDGRTSIVLRQIAPITANAIGLRLSGFASKDQDLGDIGFSAKAEGEELALDLASVPIISGNLTLPIRADGLTMGTLYTGKLWFVLDHTDLGECQLTLQMSKTVRTELDADVKTLSRSISETMLFREGNDAIVSFRLFEKTRSRRIDGVLATLDGPTESPDGSFDVNQYVDFSINNTKDPQMLDPGAVSTATRTIPKNGQMAVQVRLHDVGPGKYVFSLRFNGKDTVIPGPKIDVTVNVRHYWIWPVLAIVIALIISFVISKGVVNWRARTAVESRIAALSEQRFEQYSALPSVIFLRSILAQTKALLDEGWRLFPPPASADDYLDRAARVVVIMTRYSQLQQQLDAASVVESVKFHYREEIESIMHRITSQALDQKLTDGIVDDLGKVSAFMIPSPQSWYWTRLKDKASLLVDRANSIVWQDNNIVTTTVTDLLNTLTHIPPTYDAAQAPNVDKSFWMLNLLCHRRNDADDVVKLSETYDEKHDFQKTCVVADDLVWGRLREAVDTKARVRMEAVADAEPTQRLRPFKLEVKFDDPDISTSYLVTNVLSYKWKFELIGNSGKPKKEWTVTVNAPRITQFASLIGQLNVSLTIIRPGPLPSKMRELQLAVPSPYAILDNEELAFSRGIDKRERFLFLLVLLVALATALPALYLAKPTFGAFGDYIAILAWAIGVDQTKNIVQLLNTAPK